jgi:hypothetical protein
MNRLRCAAGLAAALAAAILPDQALAYIGPGAGLTVIGTVAALGAAVVLAIVGFVWYPLKRLTGRSRRLAGDPVIGTTPPSASDPASDPAPGATPGAVEGSARNE